MSTVIKLEHVSKYYKLGVINNGTLFRDIQTWMALKRGKHDPHSRMGEHKYDPTKNGFWALQNLDFEIQQGDRVGIIGKNGAGKSTLLKILSRITAPTEGKVKIRGRVASLLEVGTGFHGELTGRENIYLNGAILGMKRREVDRKIDEIIAFSEIEQHIDTPVKRYSSGMYVRLAFAVAAHLDSEILIADEVLAVGDASFQKKALGKMNDLSTGQGRTVLFVSHQMNSVQQLCDKGILLDSGQIKALGDIDKIISHYLHSDIYGIEDSSDLSNKKREAGGVLLRCMRITLLNAEGKKINSTQCGEKVVLRLQFTIMSEDQNYLNFGISFSETITNQRVTDVVTCRRSNEIINCKPGMYYIDFVINKITLCPGNYNLSFGVTKGSDRSFSLDHIVNAYQLKVEEKSFYKDAQIPLLRKYSVFFTEFDYEIKPILNEKEV